MKYKMSTFSWSKIYEAALLSFFGLLKPKSRMQNDNHFAKKKKVVFSFILQNGDQNLKNFSPNGKLNRPLVLSICYIVLNIQYTVIHMVCTELTIDYIDSFYLNNHVQHRSVSLVDLFN
jgi:hypothetical protein